MNTYYPIDFLANAVGIALAWAVDTVLARNSTRDINTESRSSIQ